MILILLYILLFILVVLVVSTIILYNSLVRLKNSISKAWSNIDVLLKQRFDELPKLINTVKGYAKHEKKLFNEITKARTQYDQASNIKDIAKSNKLAKNAFSKILVVAENYPNLKANKNFLDLQNRISELENMIADRREFFNNCVTIYNTRINQIPYNLLANILKYKEKDLFKVKSKEKKKIDMNI